MKPAKNKTFKANFINDLKRSALSLPNVVKVLHIFPRVFCVAKTHACCAVFAVPGTLCGREYSVVRHSSASKVETHQWHSLAYVEFKVKGCMSSYDLVVIPKPLKAKHKVVYRDNFIKEFKRAAKLLVPELSSINHILPNAFCLAKVTPEYGIFAVPTDDREIQVINDKTVTVMNSSVAHVNANSWCSLAYVSGNSGEFHVISRI